MTLTDEQLTSVIIAATETEVDAPTWSDVTATATQQRRSQVVLAVAAFLVVFATVAVAVGNRAENVETAAPEPAPAVESAATEPSIVPATRDDLIGTQWRLAPGWEGDTISLAAMVSFYVDEDGNDRLDAHLSCNPTVNDLAWEGSTFATSFVALEGAKLCVDPDDSEIDQFFRSDELFTAYFAGARLVVERGGQKLILARTTTEEMIARRQPTAARDTQGSWRVLDVQAQDSQRINGEPGPMTMTFVDNVLTVDDGCSSARFNVDWSANSMANLNRVGFDQPQAGCSDPFVWDVVDDALLPEFEDVSIVVFTDRLVIANVTGSITAIAVDDLAYATSSWSVFDLGTIHPLPDPSGLTDGMTISLEPGILIISGTCDWTAYSIEWAEGSVRTTDFLELPRFARACRTEPALEAAMSFLERPGWMDVAHAAGQLRLSRDNGTDLIRATRTNE